MAYYPGKSVSGEFLIQLLHKKHHLASASLYPGLLTERKDCEGDGSGGDGSALKAV